MAKRSSARSIAALAMFLLGGNLLLGCGAAFATEDAIRNQLARKDCVRGKFKDFYLQGQGGDPPASYSGRVFELNQRLLGLTDVRPIADSD